MCLGSAFVYPDFPTANDPVYQAARDTLEFTKKKVIEALPAKLVVHCYKANFLFVRDHITANHNKLMETRGLAIVQGVALIEQSV